MMRHSASLAMVLSAFWLLNSGHYSFLQLSLGAISVIFVVFIVHRMDVVDHESQPVYLTLNFTIYFGWLLKQVILSNIQVVKHIWLPNKYISPTLKTIKISQKTDMGKVIYANSITLTPGTVTVDLQENSLTVHALQAESIHQLEDGEMDRRVKRLEK